MYVIMKSMCPPGYNHNVFVATHALGYIMPTYIYIYIKMFQTHICGCVFLPIFELNEKVLIFLKRRKN